MKLKFIYVLIISFLITNLAVSGQNSEKFKKGVDDYTAGNYKEAIQEWVDIYNTGYRSSNLEYNIGNAYFKSGDVPHAILFYERAYLLDPSDENINYNLEIARTLTTDRFQEIPELFFVRWFNFVSLLLPVNTWGYISLITFILCLVFISVYIYSSKYGYKVTGFWLALLLFVLSFASISFSWQNRSLVYDSHKAIITTPAISGKSSPDTSGTDLFVIHEGTKVTIGEEVGDWYEIRLTDGNKGWVPATAMNII
jgi:tetratricopeptide (TPR) repeat protein